MSYRVIEIDNAESFDAAYDQALQEASSYGAGNRWADDNIIIMIRTNGNHSLEGFQRVDAKVYLGATDEEAANHFMNN